MSIVKLSEVTNEIREVCKTDKSQYPIVGLEHLTPEEYLVTDKDENAENTFNKLFRTNDVLFGRRRAYLKKASMAPFDGICSGDITVIRAIPEIMSPSLLPFIIQNNDLFDFAVGKSAGSLSPRVKWEHLGNYKFRLPALDEQGRIAEVLWSINDTRVAYQNLLALTDDFIKAEFFHILDEGTELKTYKMKDVLTQCKKKEKIEDTKAERYISVPLYGKGIKERDIGEDDLKPFTAVRLKSGQFVYSRIWVRKGACGIVPDELEGAIVTNEFPVFEINTAYVDPDFLLYSVLDERFLQQIGANSTGSTSKQRLKEVTFLNFNIILPPLNVQKRFSAMVKQGERAKCDLQISLDHLTALLHRIVYDSFIIPREED